MPSVNKRGDTFRIMVSLGYNLKGRQIRKTTTFKPPEGVTPGKAEKLAMAFAHEFEKKCQGMANMNENIRFVELVDWYYKQIAPHKLKEATMYGNRKLIDLYVLPYIGHLKLKDVTTARIDELFNLLLKNGRTTETYRLKDSAYLPKGSWRPTSRKAGVTMPTLKEAVRGTAVTKPTAEKIAAAIGKKLKDAFVLEKSGGGLDPQTIIRVRTATSPIFSTAVKKEIMFKNPVTNATSPKRDEKEKLFLDADGCRQLLGMLDGPNNPQVGRAIAMLLYTGMRVGELMALRWEDVFLDDAILTVKHTLYRAEGKYKLTSPKTKSSARVIAMPPQLVDILKVQKKWQEQRQKDVGQRWIDRGAVFTGAFGEYMNRTYLNSEFKKLLKANGLPDLHVHDLRHANASLLINMGVPVKVISEHLGHKNTLTTENIYAHIFNSTKAKASEAISQALTFGTEQFRPCTE